MAIAQVVWLLVVLPTGRGLNPGLAPGTSESLSQRISVQMNRNVDLPGSKRKKKVAYVTAIETTE
jgi:hypothetical protein